MDWEGEENISTMFEGVKGCLGEWDRDGAWNKYHVKIYYPKWAF